MKDDMKKKGVSAEMLREGYGEKIHVVPTPLGSEKNKKMLMIMMQTYFQLNDHKSYNTEKLHYVSTSILGKTECKKEYKTENNTEENEELLSIIDKYMICTLHPGNIDDKGDLVNPSNPDLEGCITKVEKLSGAPGQLVSITVALCTSIW